MNQDAPQGPYGATQEISVLVERIVPITETLSISCTFYLI